MSNTFASIPSIPNYCGYDMFKTGFSDGIGTIRTLAALVSENSNFPCWIKTRFWGQEHYAKVKHCVNGIYNTKFVPKNLKSSNLCGWFDAYSVKHYVNTERKRSVPTTYVADYGIDDHNQDIEDVLISHLQPPEFNQSDSGLSSSRNSTATSSQQHECETENLRYFSEKGCIDWLETCNVGLRKTTSHQELLKSYEDQFRKLRHRNVSQFDVRLSEADRGMYPVCRSHVQRKLGTDNSSCEDVRNVNTGETTLEEEVFEEELYYLGPPKVGVICDHVWTGLKG